MASEVASRASKEQTKSTASTLPRAIACIAGIMAYVSGIARRKELRAEKTQLGKRLGAVAATTSAGVVLSGMSF